MKEEDDDCATSFNSSPAQAVDPGAHIEAEPPMPKAHLHTPSLLEESKFDEAKGDRNNDSQVLNMSKRSHHKRAESILSNPFNR